MQLSLSLSRIGASSLAAALCLDSCRDLSTARWRCFTWERRREAEEIVGKDEEMRIHFKVFKRESESEKGSYQGTEGGEEL